VLVLEDSLPEVRSSRQGVPQKAFNLLTSDQVVLADSTFVHANETECADLFRTLKGGGANFGMDKGRQSVCHPC
jgi:hypothetical protein